jgi:hypothetical protein
VLITETGTFYEASPMGTFDFYMDASSFEYYIYPLDPWSNEMMPMEFDLYPDETVEYHMIYEIPANTTGLNLFYTEVDAEEGEGATFRIPIGNPENYVNEFVHAVTYFVEHGEGILDEYQPAIVLYPDGNFIFLINFGSGMGYAYGTYEPDGKLYRFDITGGDYGAGTKFVMRISGDTLIYLNSDNIGMTMKESIFYTSGDIPESIVDYVSRGGEYYDDGL